MPVVRRVTLPPLSRGTWTSEEEEQLKRLRGARKSWPEISMQLSGRSPAACQQRWYSSVRVRGAKTRPAPEPPSYTEAAYDVDEASSPLSSAVSIASVPSRFETPQSSTTAEERLPNQLDSDTARESDIAPVTYCQQCPQPKDLTDVAAVSTEAGPAANTSPVVNEALPQANEDSPVVNEALPQANEDSSAVNVGLLEANENLAAADEVEILRQLRRVVLVKEALHNSHAKQVSWRAMIGKDELEKRQVIQALENNRVMLEDKHEELRAAQTAFHRAQQCCNEMVQNLQTMERRLEGSRQGLQRHGSQVERLERYYQQCENQIEALVSTFVDDEDRASVDSILRGDLF